MCHKLLSYMQATTCHSPTATSGATLMDPVQQQLPLQYKRLVASRVGSNFSEVAVVQEQSLAQPAAGEVRIIAIDLHVVCTSSARS